MVRIHAWVQGFLAQLAEHNTFNVGVAGSNPAGFTVCFYIMAKDLYNILGIDKTASDDDIKKAYRKLAIKWHPDRHAGKSDEKEAEEKFKDINEAYQVLSDPDKRRQYNTFGTVDPNTQFSQGPSMDDLKNMFRNMPGFDDFDMGFGFNPWGRQQWAKPQGMSKRILIDIGVADIMKGCTKTFKVKRNVLCPHCHGTGGEHIETCQHCHGTGMETMIQRTQFGIIQQSHPCSHCHGTGKIIKDVCPECNGHGYKNITEDITVKIPAGVHNGWSQTIKGKGDEIADGDPGDLVVIVQYNIDNNKYIIDNNNIYEQTEVPVWTCLTGGSVDRVLPTGAKVTLNIPECARPGAPVKIKGKGINNGDYVFIILPKMPDKLTKEQKNIISKFKV